VGHIRSSVGEMVTSRSLAMIAPAWEGCTCLESGLVSAAAAAGGLLDTYCIALRFQ
jgi:hypothetical protein